MSGRRQRERRRTKSEQSPGSVVLGALFDRFAGYVGGAHTHAQAAAAARSDRNEAVARLVRESCGLDVVKVVASARVEMTMAQATTGSEVAVAALEIIGLALVCRNAGAPETISEQDGSKYLPARVVASAHEALSVGSLIAMFDSPPADPLGMVMIASVEREIMVRNPVYPHMLLDTLRGLLDDAAVDQDCLATLGFTGSDALRVIEAARSLSIAELTKRFRRMEAARDASLPFLLAQRRPQQPLATEPSTGDRLIMEEVVHALEGLTTHVHEAVTIQPDVLAAQLEIDVDTVQRVLEAFTLQGETGTEEVLDRFFRGDNPLRTAPIVADQEGRTMLVHDALALPAVREVIEKRLKTANRTSAYERHRGAWVEKAGVDLLAGVFSSAVVYRSFHYFVPDPAATPAQSEPDKFTKRVEGDGLILIDDVALIVEVKSVALTAEARGGVERRLRGKLRDIVTNAAAQADRLRQRIVADERVRLDDGTWIDVTGVREVHTIAVGLEDLSGVTTATAMLVDAGVLMPENIPWTVSLHDLRIVCELVDRPSELLFYLRRRTHPDATRKFLAVDELDLFLHCLNRGLYVIPDPERRAEQLPWTGNPTTSDRRRHAAQHRELIASQTDPLDAWYHSQLDHTAPKALKPCMKAHAQLLALIDEITATGTPGWLSTSTILLEGDEAAHRAFGREARRLARMVKEDGQHHSSTRIVFDTSGNPIVLTWACCGQVESADQAEVYLRDYLAAKKYQVGAHRAALLLFDAKGTALLRLIFDNRLHEFNAAAEAAIQDLVRLDQMPRVLPRQQPLNKKPRKQKRR